MPDIFDTLAAPTTPAAQPAPRDIFDDLVDAQTAQAAAPTVTLKPKTYKTKTVNGNTFIVPDEDFTQPLKPEIPLINVPKPAPSAQQRTLTSAAPEKLNAALQTPIWDYLPANMKSALSPSEFALEVAKKNPSDKFMGIVAGAESGLGKTAQAFTSPVALALLPSAGISPTAQKAMGIIFGSQMVAENPDIGKQIGEEMGKNPEDRDTAKIAALLTQGFANSSLAGLMFTHAASELLPKGSENNAIPIRSAAPVSLGETPRSGEEVGARVPTPEEPAGAPPQPETPQRAPSPQPATPGENAGEVKPPQPAQAATVSPVPVASAKPLDVVKQVSDMPADEFAKTYKGFNKINLPLGKQLATPEGISALNDAWEKAKDDAAKAKSDLDANQTMPFAQKNLDASQKAQFFRETLDSALGINEVKLKTPSADYEKLFQSKLDAALKSPATKAENAPQPVVEPTKNVPTGSETPPAQSSTDSLYEKEHADLIDAQRRMNQAQEDGDSAAARTAKQERDDILQRLDTFDSLFKRDPNAIDSKNPTVTALRRNPNLKLSDAITEGQRLAQQKKGDDAYDSALDSGASKKEAKAAAQKASTPTVRETAAGQSPKLEKVRSGSVDTPAQGVLNQARDTRAAAWKRVQQLRQQIKDNPLNSGNTRLQLIKAESSWREALRMENGAKEAIEKRANEQGQTTKSTPTAPAEKPAAAVQKVAEHIQEVASGEKKANPEPALDATTGVRAAKEIKSEYLKRVEAEMDKGIEESETTIRPRGDETPNEWLASSKNGAAYGTIEKVGNKFKVSAQRPGYNLNTATFDTMEDAQWFIKALAASAEGKVTLDIPGDGKNTVWRSGDNMVALWKKVKSLETGDSGTSKIPVSQASRTPTAEKVIKAYGSPEKAYQASVRQAAEMESGEEKTAAEKFSEEIYKSTKAANLEAQGENARATAAERRSSMEEAQAEIDRIMGLKKQNKAHLESVAQLKKEVASAKERMEFFDKQAENYEQQAAKEKASITPQISESMPLGQKPINESGDLSSGKLGKVGMGAARVGETRETPTTPTGIKNATVDIERQKRGLPPAIEPARREFGRVWDEAMAKFDQNPAIGDELVEELKNHPRAITDTENAILLRHQIDLQNDYGKLTQDLAEAHDDAKQFPNRLDDVAELKPRVASALDKLWDLYEVNKQVGTETARGLNSRKMMAYEDYSLAAMEIGKRAANGGRELTDAEHEQIRQLHDKIESLRKDYDEYVTQNDQKLSDLQAQKALDEIYRTENPPVEPHVRVIADRIKKFAKDRADAALIRINKRKAEGRTYSGIDPTELADYADFGLNKVLEKGITGSEMAAEWASEMASTFGEGIKKHLPQIWKAAQSKLEKLLSNQPDNVKKVVRTKKTVTPATQIETIVDKIRDKYETGRLDAITAYVQKLARLHVEDGISDRDLLIDAVHSDLMDIDPTISRRDTMDAISGYGKFKQLRKDQISVELRDLKGQMQQVAKLEDMQAGKPPLKTGLERRIPSKEESTLIKQVNEMKRKFQIPVTDPNTQLKSALDTLKTRMDTRTAELNEKLANGDFSTRPQREPIKHDAIALEKLSKLKRAEQAYQHGLQLDRLKNRTSLEKAQDTLVKWRRGFLLSSPITLAKLTAAAVARMTITPVEEAVGSVIARAVPALERRTQREGGLNGRAEAKALAGAVTKGMKDAWDVLRTGQSQLDVLYGQGREGYVGESFVLPRSFIDFFGAVHGALKAPVKRAEFERSLEKRFAAGIRDGVDVTDPLVQTRFAVEAFKDANRSIFLQDNRLVNALYKAPIRTLEQVDKKTGRVPIGSKALATGIKAVFPIVKVPANIVAETFQYAFGSVTGLTKLGFAFARGIETLKPEEADLIMRQLKKGSLGGAVLITGFLLPNYFGGYYQQGEKRKPGEAKYGSIKIGNVNIPSFLLHNPLLEVAQLGATVRRVADSKLHKRDIGKQGITAGLLAGGLGLAAETPFVNDTLELTKLMNPSQRQGYLDEMAKSYVVPQLVQFIANQTDKNAKGDTIARKPKTLLQHIETGIPGLRQTVPKKNPFEE